MSERPEWMPSYEHLIAAIDKDSWINGPGFPNTEIVLHRTGLRAKLHVLESLIEGQTGHMVDRAKKMIEEIRKELEHG